MYIYILFVASDSTMERLLHIEFRERRWRDRRPKRRGADPPHNKRNRHTRSANLPRHMQHQEHRDGTSQLKPTYTHRPIDKFHLGSLSTNTRSFNSMPPLTAVMLLLKKGAKLEIYFISLRHCQDRPTQHHLPFARSAPTPSVVE